MLSVFAVELGRLKSYATQTNLSTDEMRGNALQLEQRFQMLQSLNDDLHFVLETAREVLSTAQNAVCTSTEPDELGLLSCLLSPVHQRDIIAELVPILEKEYSVKTRILNGISYETDPQELTVYTTVWQSQPYMDTVPLWEMQRKLRLHNAVLKLRA
eukprot:TRINITY_DN1178_c0_g1_i1.p1 TRINITY_DN1178_c0_g1~~TRINITY_DN1178_c0_g1_i1.p1  ORF type:complete len:157 (+),score=22.09 TRINITY_DN1178_c0_g1_i1:235-705(+)